MSEIDKDNFHLWQLVWQVSQSKEKFRSAYEKERNDHIKTLEEVQYLKNLLIEKETERENVPQNRTRKGYLRKLAFWKN